MKRWSWTWDRGERARVAGIAAVLRAQGLPEKPRVDSPCNRCGLCCAASLCEAGKIALPGATAPCPALRVSKDGTACGLVLAEQAAGMEPLVTQSLGIGLGCSMADHDDIAAPARPKEEPDRG